MKRYLLLLLLCLHIATALQAKRYIATHDIKVREGKGNKYDTLGSIQKGTIIDLEDTAGAWRKIENGDGDQVGYINSKFLKEAPPEDAPPPQDASLQYLISDFVNKHTLAVLAVAVVVLIVLRRTVQSYNLRKSANTAAHYNDKQKSLIKYWYQCKHCAATIKKESEPGSNGCSKSLHHLWFQLAEIGQHKYHCKNCGVTVHTKVDPTDHGCPQSPLHRWEKKK